MSDPINNKLGRRGAIFFSGFLSLVSTIGSSLSQNWPQLLAFRIVLGVGLGIDASIVSVYAAECAPASIRGGLAVSWQMWVAFGIFLGFVANVAVYNVCTLHPAIWRLGSKADPCQDWCSCLETATSISLHPNGTVAYPSVYVSRIPRVVHQTRPL